MGLDEKYGDSSRSDWGRGIPMKILVTGGTGLLGSAVGEKLIENGLEPVLFDIAPQYEQIEKIKNKVELIRGDILEFPELLKVMKAKKVEGIIHTAAILLSAAREIPYEAIRVNILGTANILEAARTEGIQKVIFSGSASVYHFLVFRDRPITENHPIFPNDIYASTKLACEYLGENYSKLYGIKFINLRFASIYGPSYSQGGYVGSWLHPLLTAMVTGKSHYQIQRSPRRFNQYIYVQDAASALVKALFSDTESNVFNIGEGKLRTFDEVIGQVQMLFPEQRIEIVEGLKKDASPIDWVFPYDISLAEKELGFKVEFPLEKALSHYIQWLKDHL
jgi:UDP-glucose 4-epimerase